MDFYICEEQVWNKNTQAWKGQLFTAFKTWLKVNESTGEITVDYPPPSQVTQCLIKKSVPKPSWKTFRNIKVISKFGK